MLKTLVVTLSLFIVTAEFSKADTSAQVAGARLGDALEQVNFVKFYFVSRSGEYSFDKARVKSESTIRIYRSCGANCKNFMREVTAHLSTAREGKCLHGQQNLLIEVGSIETILYSYSGRMILFQGKCYFNNQRGIQKVIKNSDFLFN